MTALKIIGIVLLVCVAASMLYVCVSIHVFMRGERMTWWERHKMSTRYRIKKIKKILRTQDEWTEFYNGHEDLDEIADYFQSRGHVVLRSIAGKHNPTILAKR